MKAACAASECTRTASVRGMCRTHYKRAIRAGIDLPRQRARFGEAKPNNLGYRLYGDALLHRIIAERALGRPLRSSAPVHHADGNRTNNAHGNLVICNDQKYHALLHARAAALKATGSADSKKCKYCHGWGGLGELTILANDSAYHRACNAAYEHSRKRKGLAMNICKRSHDHAGWEECARCNWDSVSPRDPDGRLIESPAPIAEEPEGEQLSML